MSNEKLKTIGIIEQQVYEYLMADDTRCDECEIDSIQNNIEELGYDKADITAAINSLIVKQRVKIEYDNTYGTRILPVTDND